MTAASCTAYESACTLPVNRYQSDTVGVITSDGASTTEVKEPLR